MSRVILLTLVAIIALHFTAAVSADISGSVVDTSGAPVEATIRVFQGNREISTFKTGGSGVFSVQLTPGQYTLTAYADRVEDIPGLLDYLPSVLEIDDRFSGEIVLSPGATMRLNGEFQYIDTENIPLKASYVVQDSQGNPLILNGFPLEYSDRPVGAYAIPDLALKDIIIPLNIPVDVNVSTSILVNSEVVVRGFIIKSIEATNRFINDSVIIFVE